MANRDTRYAIRYLPTAIRFFLDRGTWMGTPLKFKLNRYSLFAIRGSRFAIRYLLYWFGRTLGDSAGAAFSAFAAA